MTSRNSGLLFSAALFVLLLCGAYFFALPLQADAEDVLQAHDDSYEVEEGETLEISVPGVLANDSGSNLYVDWNSEPSHGTLSLYADGNFTYTPDEGFTGEDSFIYSIRSGEETCSSCGTVTIDVKKKEPPAEEPTDTDPPSDGGSSGGDNDSDNGESDNGDSEPRRNRGGTKITRPSGNSGPGLVLGTTTAPTCSDNLLFKNYLRMGWNNNPTEVMVLQAFLNGHMNAGLSITGHFGQETYKAVEDFQVKYWEEVLLPWVPHGLPTPQTPTGFVYKTTTRWLNMMACPGLVLPMPKLP